MSGADYTLTPNFGLYKPNYALDVGRWGEHLNLNSDVIDAALATRGVVNALDYGADPTGVADSAGAINSAALQLAPNGWRKSVYLPAGTYHLRSRITLNAGQTLYGDGRGNTLITISGDFDPTETLCVVALGGSASLPDGDRSATAVSDITISFEQPQDQTSRANFKTIAAGGTSGPGGTGVRYPWAIAVISRCHPMITRVRVSAGWDGFTTNGISACFWIKDMEMGALDVGLSTGENGGVYDWSHIDGYHFTGFGIDGALATNVFADLQTIAMRVGAQNGLEARGIVSYQGRIVFTSEATDCWADITNLNLDQNGARLEIATCRYIHISNFSVIGDNALGSQVKVGGGVVDFSNWFSEHNIQAQLEVAGGDVTVTGGYMKSNGHAVPAAFVSGGTLRMSGVRCHAAVAGTWTQPLIVQFSPGVLQLNNISITGVAGASGPGITYFSDEVGHALGTYAMAPGWSVFHVLGPSGNYGETAPLGDFASDAAAATGGVRVGWPYRNGSIRMVRVT